jgi:sec-independent protein translocase protein TatA
MFSGLFQPIHLLVILGIVLIIFGPGKLPELGSGLAKGIKSFKNGMKDLKDDTDVTPIEHKEEKTV